MQLLHGLPPGKFLRTLAPTRTTRFLRAQNSLYPDLAADYLAVDVGAVPKRGALVLLDAGAKLTTGMYDPHTTDPDSVLGVVSCVAMLFQ